MCNLDISLKSRPPSIQDNWKTAINLQIGNITFKQNISKSLSKWQIVEPEIDHWMVQGIYFRYSFIHTSM